jgi:hypothetical protein
VSGMPLTHLVHRRGLLSVFRTLHCCQGVLKIPLHPLLTVDHSLLQ